MDRDDAVAPQGQTLNTSHAVGALFARILEISEIGEKDNFFEMGGDSRSAARLINVIKTEFGSDITVREFYRDPTVAGLMKIFAKSDTEV
ncbi:phosphopantetheine-binding protein [Nonomuraea sp. NPDC050643]|uniref:phosphopantetheine-binding protein n=1 Tax=Nonomuraea sp. NPDC050643 TaxID=3155660 RepID=UPI0033D5491A